jgi:hypothetical protein
LDWRIDIQSSARDSTELNEPTAIVEMAIKNQVMASHYNFLPKLSTLLPVQVEDSNVIRFEMGREKVSELLTQIGAIQNCINNVSTS